MQIVQVCNEKPDLSTSSLGKRASRPLVSSVAGGSSKGTMFILELKSKRKFLVDSGADECVFPASDSNFTRPRTTSFIAANGSAIKTFGKRTLQLSFAPGHEVSHQFWIADVSRPILGADFYSDHGSLIDLSRQQLILSLIHI